jgi:hypothetical protein
VPSTILGTVVFFYGGLVFIRGAWGELADRKPGISMGIIVAFRHLELPWLGHSAYSSLRFGGNSHQVLAQSNELSDSIESFIRVMQGGGLLNLPALFVLTTFHVF